MRAIRLSVLGGGGFRVPLVYRALATDPDASVEEVVLHDTDPERLRAITAVLAAMRERYGAGPVVRTTTDLDAAIEDTDVVFSAMRVGGMAARTLDERVALELGVLGQETVGAGGIAYGLRTLPVALDVAERVQRLAPRAWVIDFTNPAGMITEAMSSVLGDRVVGICDSPLALVRRAAAAAGSSLPDVEIDYAGLNHLGWVQSLRLSATGADLLPGLLADPDRLTSFEEGRLFGADWLATLGALPNEYLYYYDFAREALAAISGAAQTRGELLVAQQEQFYASVRPGPQAYDAWEQVRRERDSTYLAEGRTDGSQRDEQDVAGGGYEQVALAFLHAVTGARAGTGAEGSATRLILNVRGRGAVPGLPDDAVVEVPCTVGVDGPTPLPVTPLTGRMLGLVHQVKAAERATIGAVRSGSPAMAVQAFATHPLVDSVSTARALLDGYRRAIPQVDGVFTASGGAPGPGTRRPPQRSAPSPDRDG